MLRTFTTTSLAALVAATFSAGALAETQSQEQQTQYQQQQQRQHDRSQMSYERGGDHSDKSIAEVLNEQDQFSKFHEALEQADMKDELENSNGTYTVFAPTNEAFERLPQSTWDEWMDDDNRDQLRDVLSNHIVEERIGTNDFGDRRGNTGTMNGGELRITESRGAITVNTANVSHADIETENGYIHAIDSVILNGQRGGRFSTSE